MEISFRWVESARRSSGRLAAIVLLAAAQAGRAERHRYCAKRAKSQAAVSALGVLRRPHGATLLLLYPVALVIALVSV